MLNSSFILLLSFHLVFWIKLFQVSIKKGVMCGIDEKNLEVVGSSFQHCFSYLNEYATYV